MGFGVWGLEFVVWGLEFGVWSVGFGVWGFWLRSLVFVLRKSFGLDCMVYGSSLGLGCTVYGVRGAPDVGKIDSEPTDFIGKEFQSVTCWR